MDLHELLGKIASQTVLAVDPGRGLHGAHRLGGRATPSLFLFNTVVAAFVILILLEPLRAKVEEQVVAIFFRERFELLRRARRAARADGERHRHRRAGAAWCWTRSTRRGA